MGIDFRRPRHIRGFRLGEALIFGPGIGRVLVEKTASGAIAHIEDGADGVPLKNWLVTLPASLDGYTEVSGVRTGRNLIDDSKRFQANKTLVVNQTDNTSFATFLKAGTYTISYSTTATACYIYRREENDASNTNMGKSTSATFTLAEDGHFRFWLYGDDALSENISNFQLEIGSTAHDYEQYQTPTTYTASLGRTIYGGQADIVKGEGQETHTKMTFVGADAEKWSFSSSGSSYRVFAQLMNAKTDTNTFASNLITPAPSASGYPAIGTGWINNNGRIVIGVDSSITSASDWKTYLSNNNMEIAYELADEYKTDFTFTPITPTPETALGVNNFWADSSDSSVTYRADQSLIPDTPTRSLQLSPSPEVDEEVEEGVDDMR